MPSPHTLYYWTAALANLAVWYAVLVLLQKPRSGRRARLLLPLLSGMLGFRALGWCLNFWHPAVVAALGGGGGSHPLLMFIADVGLREELAKLLAALSCLLWLRRAGDPGWLPGAATGLGFAFEENRWFFASHPEPTLLVGRLLGATLLHLSLTGLGGEAFVRAVEKAARWPKMALTLAAVAVLHGVYDWAPVSGQALLTGGTSWISLLAVMASATWFLPLPNETASRRVTPWFLCGVLGHFAAALAITFFGWGSFSALMTCARECAIFLPVAGWLAFLLTARRGNSSSF